MTKGISGCLLKAYNGRRISPLTYPTRWIEGCGAEKQHRALVFCWNRYGSAVRDMVEFFVWRDGILVDYRLQEEIYLSKQPTEDPIVLEMIEAGFNCWYEFPPTVLNDVYDGRIRG
jgi:hypothetical protein